MKRRAQFFAAALTVAMLSSAADASIIDVPVEFPPFDAGPLNDKLNGKPAPRDHHSKTENSKVGGFATFEHGWTFSLSSKLSDVTVKLTNDFQDQNPLFDILGFLDLSVSWREHRKVFVKHAKVSNIFADNPHTHTPQLSYATAVFPGLTNQSYLLTVKGNSPLVPKQIAGYRYGITLHADALNLSPVPIPAGMWLFLTALGGLGMIGYRRAQSSMAS